VRYIRLRPVKGVNILYIPTPRYLYNIIIY